MAFKKGDPRPPNSGRKKGTPNNHAAREKVIDKLARLNFDPVERLVQLARSKKTNTELKIRCLGELMRYAHPRLSTTAVLAQIDHNLEITQKIVDMAKNPELANAMEAIAVEMARQGPELSAPREGDVIDVKALENSWDRHS
jgi:hypothetical protein